MIHSRRAISYSYSVESIYHEKQAKIAGISKKSCQKVVKTLFSPKTELSKVVIDLDLLNQIIIAGRDEAIGLLQNIFCS